MKDSLYTRVRVYTYLVILMLSASFAVAAGAFYYFETRIGSQLHRSAHFHARTTQLAISIQQKLLPLQALLEAHDAPLEGYGEAALADYAAALSLMPTALYNIEAAFDGIVGLQQEFGDAQFDQTIGKIERGIALLERLNATPTSGDQAANAAAFATALRTLILAAGQLERLHLVAGGRLDRRIDAEIDDRNTILLPLSSAIVVLGIVALVYLMSQIRATFMRQEEANNALLESEKSYRTLVETIPYGVVETDLTGTIVFSNHAYARMLGAEERDFVGKKIWAHLPDEESRRGLQEHLQFMVEQQPPMAPVSAKNVCKDGVEIDVEITWGYRRDAAGNLAGLVAVVSDVSARLQLEDALLQSQKLEAMGQLTGGIAHEFNNLLGIVQGNAEFLAGQEGSDTSLTAPILRAAARGSKLTKHLLSFARKQPLNPQVIDLGGQVESMSLMLTQSLGTTIEIDISVAPSLWAALADPLQLETALLNLAINARDAMPEGGKVQIECGNVHLEEEDVAEDPQARAGDYVLIAVSDRGTGMSDTVRAHAFEPFYTTKEVGKGTGLGLSMVYGFADQSGGHVSIDSKVGHGTTVKLYLPRHGAVVPLATTDEKPETPRGRGEAVLVIEDDREMRDLAVNMLNTLGYRVTEVPEARSARAVLESGEAFDLVLSDIVLPGGMNGPEFAEEMSARDPDVKFIFMSGYPAEAAKHSRFPGPPRALLSKPFLRSELAKALRDALD